MSYISELATFLVMCKIYLVISYATAGASSIGSYSEGKNVCITDACTEAASLFSKNMNESVDPCDDFYQFACGNFIASSKIPMNKDSIVVFNIRSKKIRDKLEKSLQEEVAVDEPRTFQILKHYYKKCLDEEEFKEHEYREILGELGGWPLLEGKSWNESNFDWINTTYQFQKLGYMGQDFVKITAKRTATNFNKISIEISPPETIGNDEYFKEMLLLNKTDAFLKYMVSVAKVFRTNSDDVTQEINQMFDFEIELSKIAFKNTIEEKHTMTMNELQKKFASINWLDYFNKMLYPHLKLLDIHEVVINNATYLKNLFQLMGKTPKRELANYAFKCFFEQYTKTLSSRLQKIKSNFLKDVKGTNFVQYQNSKDCVHRLVKDFSVATKMFYVKKHFDTKKKELLHNMAEDIRSSFSKILENTSWFDPETKNNTLEKLAKIFVEIGYPDELSNTDVLDSYYSYLDVNSTNSVKTMLSILGKNKRFYNVINYFNSSWFLFNNLDTVNAVYLNDTNTMDIFLGLIESVIVDAHIPKFFTYGSMGFIIAHELSHAFDDADKFVSWKSNNSRLNSTEEEFLNRTRCIAQQYSNYSPKGLDVKLNGEKTLQEDIADNVGFKAAYNAYKGWQEKNGQDALLPGLEKYTPNQMFWLSSAQFFCEKISKEGLKLHVEEDSHTVKEFRVTGSLHNRPEFAEDFKCPLGSRMNPVNKCILYKK